MLNRAFYIVITLISFTLYNSVIQVSCINASETDYSGLYFSVLSGDASIEGYMKITQTNSNVEIIFSWDSDIYLGSISENMIVASNEGTLIYLTFSDQTNFDGSWQHEGMSGTVSGYKVDDSLWSFPEKIEANPSKEFYWPYYLFIPTETRTMPFLIVEPNNTGITSDDFSVHDEAARNLINWRSGFASDLGMPLLVPVFPRPYTNWQVYTHALDRDTLLTDIEGLQRIDLQLIAMINDAIERLSTKGVYVGRQVFMMGFSASGMFVNRFTVIHPEMVRAAAIGSPGGWPIAPVPNWQGEDLRYHVGISDLDQLIGYSPNIDLFKTIPLYFYIGALDTNDSVPYDDSFVVEDRELVNRLFGSTPVERWPRAKEIYDSIGCESQFIVYPGVGHTITSQMLEDIGNFFLLHTANLKDAVVTLQVLSGKAILNSNYSIPSLNANRKIGLKEVIFILQKTSGLRSGTTETLHE